MQLKWPMLWDLFSLFPAYAGVIRQLPERGRHLLPFPRIRGGDPWSVSVSDYLKFFSPHTRG